MKHLLLATLLLAGCINCDAGPELLLDAAPAQDADPLAVDAMQDATPGLCSVDTQYANEPCSACLEYTYNNGACLACNLTQAAGVLVLAGPCSTFACCRTDGGP